MTAPSTIKQKFLSQPDELGVVAVGFSGGQGKQGVDTGPSSLIKAGLLTQLSTDLGYKVLSTPPTAADGTATPTSSGVHTFPHLKTQHTADNDAPHRNMKNPRLVSAVNRELHDLVHAHAAQGRLVLTLGGDHSIAVGSVSGVARAVRERFRGRREVAVVWVDAHADINTPELSDSGNIHGMPVAFLTGLAREKDQSIFGWLADKEVNPAVGTGGEDGSPLVANGVNGDSKADDGFVPVLSTKKLVYIALRDVDRGEKDILRKYGIKAFSMHDIDRHGIGKVMDMALAHIGADTPIHLSFDVDALDPQWAPATGTPVRGGLTLREGDYIAECVAATGQLVAMDLVEVNPKLDAAGAQDTIGAGCSLVRCALGDTLL